MQVNPSNQLASVPGFLSPAKAPSPRLEKDQAAIGHAEALAGALTNTPELRPEKVAEAKELVRQADYPPPVVIQRLARLLATHLESNGS